MNPNDAMVFDHFVRLALKWLSHDEDLSETSVKVINTVNNNSGDSKKIKLL